MIAYFSGISTWQPALKIELFPSRGFEPSPSYFILLSYFPFLPHSCFCPLSSIPTIDRSDSGQPARPSVSFLLPVSLVSVCRAAHSLTVRSSLLVLPVQCATKYLSAPLLPRVGQLPTTPSVPTYEFVVCLSSIFFYFSSYLSFYPIIWLFSNSFPARLFRSTLAGWLKMGGGGRICMRSPYLHHHHLPNLPFSDGTYGMDLFFSIRPIFYSLNSKYQIMDFPYFDNE